MSLQRPAYEEIIDVEAFIEAYGCDTPHEALKAAERAHSVTEYDVMEPRCSQCFSVKVVEKKSHHDIPNRRPEPWKCVECGSHLWETMPSIAEIREETRDDLATAARHADRLARVVGVDR